MPGQTDKAAPATNDTPGRPKPSSSRQQEYPDQSIQSGSPQLDHDSSRTAKPDDIDEGEYIECPAEDLERRHKNAKR